MQQILNLGDRIFFFNVRKKNIQERYDFYKTEKYIIK